jgi:U3 small nucleolar RNA-associated protein 14
LDEDEPEPVDQNSGSEDEEEEGEDGEFIDVLDILDGRGEPDNDSDVETPGKATPRKKDDSENDDENSEGEDEAEEEDSNMQDAFMPSDQEDTPDDALDDLQNFISNLSSTPQKRPLPEGDAAPSDSRPRKRRMLKERTETGLENEFRARTSGMFPLLAPSSNKETFSLNFLRCEAQPR